MPEQDNTWNYSEVILQDNFKNSICLDTRINECYLTIG